MVRSHRARLRPVANYLLSFGMMILTGGFRHIRWWLRHTLIQMLTSRTRLRVACRPPVRFSSDQPTKWRLESGVASHLLTPTARSSGEESENKKKHVVVVIGLKFGFRTPQAGSLTDSPNLTNRIECSTDSFDPSSKRTRCCFFRP